MDVEEQTVPQGTPGDTDSTGNSAVDEVLDWVAGLDDVPLADHPAVYERAHTRLRQALDAPGAVPGAPTPDVTPAAAEEN